MKQIIIIILIFPAYLYSAEVDSTKALLVAQNFAYDNFVRQKGQSYESFNPVIAKVIRDNVGRPILYFVNIQPKGYVVITGDTRCIPVVLSSERGFWDKNKLKQSNDPIVKFINNIREQVIYVINNNLNYTQKIIDSWLLLSTYNNKSKFFIQLPLLGEMYWQQDSPYNQFCPQTGGIHPTYWFNYGDRTPLGCVSVAMGQIMRYWMWPPQGNGSKSYIDPNNTIPILNQKCDEPDPSYGLQQANFGSTIYNFWDMPLNNANSMNSLLMRHAGIAAETDYVYCVSTAKMSKARDAFVNHFRMSSYTSLKEKFYYTWSNWESMINNELILGRPVLFSGQDAYWPWGDSEAHAMVIFGSQSVANYYLYLFNRGHYNNWQNFYWRALRNVHPQILYAYSQKIITGVMPDGSSIAPCSNITTIQGAGPDYSESFMGGGIGAWNTTTNNACGYQTTGVEKVFSFVPPVTGVYSIQVTEADGWVDYMWKSGSCFSMGWNCLASVASPGTYGSMNMTAGTTYYILLDDDNSIPGLHTFYINAPTITCKPCPEFDYTISPISSWQTHSSTHGPNGCKMYRVSFTSGQSYVFKTGCGDGATANYDTYLELYDSSCNLVASDDDGCESLRSIIEWTANYSGYAYLRVRGDGNSSGNYTLAYNRCVVPSSPGTISGPTTVCSGNCHTYTISPVSGATSYQWEYNGGGTPSGSGTSITLCPTSNGTLRVRAVNSCGSSSWRERSITVNHAPSMPGFITGPETVTEGNCGNYSISAVSGATSYEWQFTGGGTPSGSGTSITLCPTSSGTLRVRAVNSCGSSSWREKAITVVGTPTIIVSPTSLSFNAVVGYCDTKQYQLTGSDLTGSVSINTPAAFQVSTSPTSGFTNSISIAQSGGNVNTTIYVRFCPLEEIQYSDGVEHSSPGATNVILEVSGTGADSGIATISAIQVAQRLDGSGLIDVYFTLNAPDVLYDISLQISFDGGSSYTSIDNEHLIGDFASIGPGSDKHIVWYGLEGFEGTYSLEAMLDITASVVDDDGPLGTVTDIDGNVYQTVIIGNQEWMAENLRVSKYNNGNAILAGLSNTAWSNTTSGAYAIYDHNASNTDGINSPEEMVAAYGKLYNWYALVDARGLCPEGWSVPSHDDWTQLERYICNALGNSNCATQFPYDHSTTGWRGTNEGNALKSCRQAGSPLDGCNTSEHPRWNSDGTHSGFDEFGFSALPGGYRWSNGSFSNLGARGTWWSSTEYSSTRAWSRYIYCNYGNVRRLSYRKSGGFSLRCVRDVSKEQTTHNHPPELYPRTSANQIDNVHQPTLAIGLRNTGQSPVFTFDMRLWELTTEASPTEGGTVSEGGSYLEWKPVQLEATPEADYAFVSWSHGSDIVSSDASFIFTMPGVNINLIANFITEGIIDNIFLSDEIILSGETECFDALQTITVSDFIVETGGSATLIAGESIHLLPGTTVEYGGYLLARIATHEYDYCGIPRAIKIIKEPVASKEDDVVFADFPYEIRENGFFKLYPNPTDGTFTLELTTAELEQSITVEVHYMLGGRLFTKELPPQRLHTLSLEGQQPGMYIIRVMKGDKLGVERLIKR